MSQVIKEIKESLTGKYVRFLKQNDTAADIVPEYQQKSIEPLSNLMIVAEDYGDTLVLAYKYENGTGTITVSEENFKQLFKVEPDNIIDLELKTLLTDAGAVKVEMESINDSLDNFVAMNEGGEVPNANQLNHGETPISSADDKREVETNALAVTGHDQNPISMARNIGRSVADLRDSYREKNERLTNFVKKIKALEILRLYQMELFLQIKSKLEKIETVLQTINLYLGSGEQIVQLRQGKWADREAKLHLRQLVLFADEESELLIEKGGMDFRYLEDFDYWLISREKHIRQIIPEEKCIVALKPRRRKKDYESNNPFFESQMERSNKQTYILIRHGENLFRIAPDWAIGDRLFPTQKEMDDYFVIKEWNRDTDRHEKVRVTPEHRDYRDCLKKFNEAHLHYRNSLVLIQGVIDRTGIFPDLQERGVNLLWQESFRDEIVLIHDADESRLLTTGRESFAEYQKRLNSQLEAGHRIILGNLYTMTEKEKRYYPKYASNAPDNENLYTLENNNAWDFCIRYENDYSWRDNTRRASLGLRKTDDFILAFDLTTAEEMDRFLNDRISRPDYLNLIPMIKRIRKLKRAEEKAEEPFVLMLAAQMLQINSNLEQSESFEKAKEFLKWWKFKNKVHRALSENEVKAVKQILAEYRQVISNEVTKFDVTPFVNEQTLILYQRGRKLVRMNKHDNFGVLLDKTEYAWEKGTWQQAKEEKAVTYWRELPKADILFEHPDWQRWGQGTKFKKIFWFWEKRDLDFVIGQFDNIYAELKKNFPQAIRGSYWNEQQYHLLNSFPLAMRFDAWSRKVEVWVYLEKLEHRSMACQISGDVYVFEVDYLGDKFQIPTYHRHRKGINGAKEILSGKIVSRQWFPAQDSNYFGKLFHENLPRLLEAEALSEFHNEKVTKLFKEAQSLVKRFQEHYDRLLEDEAIEKYLANFGDMRNWASYRKKAGIKFVTGEEIKQIQFIAERLWADQERFPRTLFVGKTWEEFQDVWNLIGLNSKKAKEDVYWKSLSDRKFPERFLLIDKDFVLFPKTAEVSGDKAQDKE